MLPPFFPKLGAVLAVVFFVFTVGGAGFFALTGEEDHHEKAPSSVAAEREIISSVEADKTNTATKTPWGWTIVKEDSRIGFTAEVQGKPFAGEFTDFTGEIIFNPDDLSQSHADVRVQIVSIRSGSPERDEYIRMPAWMDATAFPEARFVSDRFEHRNGEEYVVHGALTLRGVSKAMAVPFHLSLTEDDAGRQEARMRGHFDLSRLDFGIGGGEWADPETVAHSVRVDMALVAVRK